MKHLTLEQIKEGERWEIIKNNNSYKGVVFEVIRKHKESNKGSICFSNGERLEFDHSEEIIGRKIRHHSPWIKNLVRAILKINDTADVYKDKIPEEFYNIIKAEKMFSINEFHPNDINNCISCKYKINCNLFQ